MSASPKTALARQTRLLSTIVKLVRNERRMTAAAVAQGMEISPRAYHDFEKGERAYDFNKVRLFARATRSDASAIHLGVQYGWPELPVLVMDNKLPASFFVLLRDTHGRYGERLAQVPPQLVVSGFRYLEEEIDKHFARQDANAEDYISRAIQKTYEEPGDGS